MMWSSQDFIERCLMTFIAYFRGCNMFLKKLRLKQLVFYTNAHGEN